MGTNLYQIVCIDKDEILKKITSPLSRLIGEEVSAYIVGEPYVGATFHTTIKRSLITKRQLTYEYDQALARFSLSDFPGCCSYLVSHDTLVNYDFRNRGIAQLLQPIKENIARMAGYTFLVCTTITSNEAQNHILQKFGWEKVYENINRRTGNSVIQWMKKISYE